ncbi:MAG: hypothetical protein AAF742_06940, partial [Pseudomonadota bacterium]
IVRARPACKGGTLSRIKALRLGARRARDRVGRQIRRDGYLAWRQDVPGERCIIGNAVRAW